MTAPHNKGFTLLELMIVIVIVGIVASLAVPSFSGNIEKSRLKEAAESLKSDFMYAKTEALKRSSNIQLTLVKNGADWCYGVNDDNTACACGVVTVADCGIKSIMGSRFEGVALDAATATTFASRRGTANNIGPILSTTNRQVAVVVSGRGRIRICNNVAGDGLLGYPDC